MKLPAALFFIVFAFGMHAQSPVTKDDIYEFINQQIADSSIVFNKLSAPDSSEIMDAVRRYPSLFKPGDTEYIKKQLSAKKTRMEKSRLKKQNILLISGCKIKRVFRKGGWNKFHEKVGTGYYSMDKPIFSADKTVAIFISGYYCGSLCGRGDISIYKKENGVWIFVQIVSMWVS